MPLPNCLLLYLGVLLFFKILLVEWPDALVTAEGGLDDDNLDNILEPTDMLLDAVLDDKLDDTPLSAEKPEEPKPRFDNSRIVEFL